MTKELFKIALILFINFNCILLTNAQESIIKTGDTWDYFDIGYLDNDWMNHPEKYNWKEGKTPFGYGEVITGTKISFGDDPEHKELIEYFKKEIFIDKTKYLAYELRSQIDDGAVIYINGEELSRINLPKISITRNTEAVKTIEKEAEGKLKVKVFDKDIFKEGKNIITVSVHQAYDSSSDCYFNLEIIGHNSQEIIATLLENKNKENDNLETQISQLNTKFEFEKIRTHNEALEYTNYTLKLILIICCILFVLILLLIASITFNLKNKVKEVKTEAFSLKEKNLEKHKEVIFLTANLLNNKQYFKEIKADVRGIKTDDKSIIKDIVFDIDTVLKNDKEWETLKTHFNFVFNGFYDTLLKLHPNLSETELRHCMFVKLHMQTKEVARILLIDPRSVQTTRYRIKKKMELNEDIDLRDYLLNLN